MRPILTALTIVTTLHAFSASASPTSRTAAPWVTLCRGAQRPEMLDTITLLRTKNRALAASLKSAGYPTGWHQNLAGVLVDHSDGTCGYDNRVFLQLSPKDPEGDLDGNGIINIDDPFPDGALLTDPGIQVPTGYVWSAKFASAGAQLYLPPSAETPTRIAAERDKFIALAQTLCTESGRTWNAFEKTCPRQAPPQISAVHVTPHPHQSVATGTVNSTPLALIAVVILGWLLFALMASKAALELESEEARAALAEPEKLPEKLLVGAEDRIRMLEESATTLRRERAEAQVDTQRMLQIAREQQRVLLMISRGGASQLTKVNRIIEAMDTGLRGADYFLRVKCPRPGKGERAGKTPRDKAHAELSAMMNTLRALLPTRWPNGRRAAVPAQAQSAA